MSLDLLYSIGKDIAKMLEWKEVEKLVDNEWLGKSGFDKYAAGLGYTLRWTASDRIESRKLDGYEVVFEIDDAARERRRLARKGGLVLMGKK